MFLYLHPDDSSEDCDVTHELSLEVWSRLGVSHVPGGHDFNTPLQLVQDVMACAHIWIFDSNDAELGDVLCGSQHSCC